MKYLENTRRLRCCYRLNIMYNVIIIINNELRARRKRLKALLLLIDLKWDGYNHVYIL